ncbi:essential meiotic structure-specific endonuclease subunit 2 isoform X2 [Brachyhypopomus gauderio]|uniref:essential meiotic structure-specific endonuclease subunit 2 isoform X2 n=1 Tax=Brachyhypopomus gauderio TaxID=698409 RepID=UPI004041158F
MSRLKRAKTWEISDSEGEDDVKHTGARDEDVEQERAPRTYTRTEDPATRSPRTERRVEERRSAREKERWERERVKEERRHAQQRRKEEAERVKSLKPENFLKSLTVRIHPVLLQDPGCDVLLVSLEGLEWSSRLEEHALTHSISWTRQPQDDDGTVVEEDQVLMVVSQEEFVVMVTSIKQPLSKYLKRNRGTVISLLVTGDHRHQCGLLSGGGGHDACLRSQLALPDVDIEEVLVYLQLCKNVSVHFVLSWEDVTDHVCAITKALSKRPFKALCEASVLGFCVDGSWAGGARVERCGRGLAQVWLRQIQQLNRVSVSMAAAVTTAFPSPHLLLQAYENAESEEQRRTLLADLTVMGGAKERRLGPELSNRLYRLMTSQNSQLVLD